MRPLLLLLALAAPAVHAQAPPAQTPPAGDWRAQLDAGPAQLELILRISTADSLAVTLDIPQQGALAVPATSAALRGDTLVVEYAQFGGRVDLAVAADSLRGTFTQGGQTIPIAFGPAAPIRRPQTPAPPFPYAEETVTVEAADGATLAGTFVRPAGAGPFPAVLFLSGSGAQDRDQTLFQHRTFAVIADALARAGVASMRFDDRGEGASTGAYEAAGLDVLTDDARRALAALRARPETARTGVVGHSLGGLLAPRLAAEADFLVLLAAPAVPGTELLPAQVGRTALATGAVDSTAAAVFADAIRATLAPLVARPTAPDSVLVDEMSAALNVGLRPMESAARMRLGLTGPNYPQARAQIARGLLAPEVRGLVLADPAADLAAVRVPTLAAYGTLDLQVPADLNADAMRAALAGAPGAQVLVLEGKNHLFQTATTGAVAEYGQIEETVAPDVLEALVRWISETAR